MILFYVSLRYADFTESVWPTYGKYQAHFKVRCHCIDDASRDFIHSFLNLYTISNGV